MFLRAIDSYILRKLHNLLEVRMFWILYINHIVELQEVVYNMVYIKINLYYLI